MPHGPTELVRPDELAPRRSDAPSTDGPLEEPGVTSSDVDRSRERLLAAVRAEVIEAGIDKVSATSVARRAGLARITLYRRGGDVKRLILSAVTVEAESVISAARCGLPEGTGRARLVELAVRLVRGVAGSEFVGAIVRGNPGLLEPYLTDHLGSSQRALLAAAGPELARGMADGSIRPADARVVGTVLLQALTPFAVAASIAERELGEDVVDRELRRLVDGYLRPTEAPL